MFYLMLHSHIHDLYWMQNAQNWSKSQNDATLWKTKEEAMKWIDHAKSVRPYSGVNHISIQNTD